MKHINVMYKHLVAGQRFTELPPVVPSPGIGDFIGYGDIWTKQSDGTASRQFITGFKDVQTANASFYPDTVVTLVNPN